MRIEQLKTSPDRAGRYLVRFEDGSTMRLYRQTVEDFFLCSGKELTDDQMRALRSATDEMSAKMRAVRIISASNVSRRDLESRLIQKGEKPAQAKDAVAWLEDLNLLDDRKTAEQIVHTCISKGYGKSRAKQVLFEKRIPNDIWDEVLQDYPDQEDRIRDFLRVRLSTKNDQKEVKRAIDALIRKGHSYSAIRSVLNSLDLESECFLEEY